MNEKKRSLWTSFSGEAYLTQLPFFQGLYDAPGAGAVNPNYDINLLGNYAVTRCTSPFPTPTLFFLPILPES